MKDKSNDSFYIDSHYEELGFTWLFYFYFAEKCVTLGQGFYSKLFYFHVLGVREKPAFLYHIYGQYVRIVKRN